MHIRSAHTNPILVMPGPVPGIHVFKAAQQEDVDRRDKPGHDEREAVGHWQTADGNG